VRVRELLVRDGVDVSYTTLRRYARDEFGWRERAPTVRVDDPPPGEEAHRLARRRRWISGKWATSALRMATVESCGC
jgi:hypothetical protein